MSSRPNALLFVYGTLRRDVKAPAFALFAPHADFFDHGSIAARLYDFGRYPGIVLSQDPNERVQGEVYALRRVGPTLALLDRYEGVAGTRPGAAPYARVSVPVATRRHGAVRAWVYVYLRSVAELPQIVSGDYVAFLRTRPGYRPPQIGRKRRG